MSDVKMQLMDQKIKKFKEFMDGFVKDFDSGYLSYNMWQTQHETLRIANEKLAEKNKQAEDQFLNTMKSNDVLKAQGEQDLAKVKAESMVLWNKAYAKYKEVEKLLDDADKKRIKESLKTLESMAA